VWIGHAPGQYSAEFSIEEMAQYFVELYDQIERRFDLAIYIIESLKTFYQARELSCALNQYDFAFATGMISCCLLCLLVCLLTSPHFLA
jgi:hypothetical protein